MIFDKTWLDAIVSRFSETRMVVSPPPIAIVLRLFRFEAVDSWKQYFQTQVFNIDAYQHRYNDDSNLHSEPYPDIRMEKDSAGERFQGYSAHAFPHGTCTKKTFA